MISAKDLTKDYGAVRAVAGASFDVERGEIVGLLGHNGAGKTTLMKMITGYIEPTRGWVSVGGLDVLENRIGVQRLIGYLPENAPSYEEMLVQEYLLMMAELRGLPEEQRQGAVVSAARETGLERRLTQPIATLSKGYRQRVGLAQAILHQPEVLILDEPTNGLDPVQIVEIRSLIKRLAENSTVILSTHILPEIEAVCDRVVVLIDGEIAADAPLEELLASRRVTLSLQAGAESVAETLRRIAHVEGVAPVGDDPSRPGFRLWSVECSAEPAPVPEIARQAADAGWALGMVAADTPSLEQVFGDLMADHVERRRSGQDEEVAA